MKLRKKLVSTECMEQHKNNGMKLLCIWKGLPSPQDLALYAKVCTFCPNSLRTTPETQWLLNKNNKLSSKRNRLLLREGDGSVYSVGAKIPKGVHLNGLIF